MISSKEIARSVRDGELDFTKYMADLISKIKTQAELNAFLEVFEEEAISRAKEVSEKIQKGTAGRLAGMVVALKDNICFKGHRLGASSKILEGFRSLFDATVVERLLKEDAIIIGRLNCDEFAMGSSNENSAYGPVKNPLNALKVAGGSSGGAAAAVAADLCHVALGSDTGGSIRQPASFTDIIGFKPTYGRVSRHGLIAYASSFDQIGPMGKDLSELAEVMEVISGKDAFDSTLVEREVPKYGSFSGATAKKKFAYYRSYIEHPGLDPEVKKYFNGLLAHLKKEGHEVIESDFPYLNQIVPTYYVLTTAEASSNLARYDGIHFGHRSKDVGNLNETYVNSRTEGFGKEVKRRIMLGTYVLSEGYHDAYYTKGQKVRRLMRDRTNELLQEVDFILSPTSPHTAFDIGAQSNDPIKMYLEDIFTAQANICGLPAVSLPLGHHSNKMPFGIQLMSKAFSEKDLFEMSAYLMNNESLAFD